MSVKEFYDRIAEKYDDLRYGTAYHREVAELELQFIQPYLNLKSRRCLEVGAGTGRVTRVLVEHAAEVVAVDLSPQMLEQLKARLAGHRNLTTQTVDIYELHTLPGYGEFDIVVCLRVLPHLEDPLTALRRLQGAVKEDGVVIVDLWNSLGYQAWLRRLRLRPSAVYTRYHSWKEMHALIQQAGLKILARRGFGFPPVRVCLLLERAPQRWLDYWAQRIIWICQPR